MTFPLESFRRRIAGLFDIRPGEGQLALGQFATVLLSIVTGHTILETARDALLLTGPGPRALGLVYIGIAICTIPCATLVSRAGERFGTRKALGVSLVLAATTTVLLFFLPRTPWSAIAVYVASGVIASVLVPQFWILVAGVLTVAQGRRLFGVISAAGVLGGVLGSGVAASVITIVPARTLLLLAAAMFLLTAALLTGVRGGTLPTVPQRTDGATQAFAKTFRDRPYLVHLALIVFLSTATVLLVDYLFKSTVARDFPPAQVGPRVARYYLAFNLVSLFVQVFLGSALVKRMGFVAALVLTPGLLLLGAVGAFITGGAMLAVLLLKGIDGGLRYSLHRITEELAYLPLPFAERGRVKPMIDGALGRAAQTVTGGCLLAFSGTALLWPRSLALLVAGGATAWIVAAVGIRRPYVALLRRAIVGRTLDTDEVALSIDSETAEFLIERLASEDSLEVVAAMDALVRRGRGGFIPALVLGTDDDAVLIRALDIFGASERSDWIPLGIRALSHPHTRVRLAAARALAKHDRLDGQVLANDSRARIRGYAAVMHAVREGRELLDHPEIIELLRRRDEVGETGRLGMLAALGDAPPTPAARDLLHALSEQMGEYAESIELLAEAVVRLGDTAMIPRLTSLLPMRSGREAVRVALAALGDPAFDCLSSALEDASAPRRLRIHLPKTLARFANRRVSDRLMDCAEADSDGLVRYKAIRALGVLAATQHVAPERARAERLCEINLDKHFRILALRTALATLNGGPDGTPASLHVKLLLGLLDDKLRHSLERAFRLLKAAHPREDIHRVHLACVSADKYARANAGELLDALLRHADQERLRELLRLVADDLAAAERVDRYQSLVEKPIARTADDALTVLHTSPDPMAVALSQLCAAERLAHAAESGTGEVKRGALSAPGGAHV